MDKTTHIKTFYTYCATNANDYINKLVHNLAQRNNSGIVKVYSAKQ